MKDTKIAHVRKETFAIIKAKKTARGAFANIEDGKETTVIIHQNNISKQDIIEIEKEFKLITFKMILPFSMVGFIAKIAKKLADAEIPIFIISAYSTDHLLVKKKYLKKTLIGLKSLGFEIK